MQFMNLMLGETMWQVSHPAGHMSANLPGLTARRHVPVNDCHPCTFCGVTVAETDPTFLRGGQAHARSR